MRPPAHRPTGRPLTRQVALARLRHQLERASSPRVQMSLIVVATGLAGWLASALLLGSFGVDAMALRYPLAVAFAYLVFLGLLWAWLRLDLWDVADLVVPAPDGTGRSAAGCTPGGGGDFGGAGATATFTPRDAGLADGMPGVVGDAASASLDADEAAVPLLALLVLAVMALGLVVTSVWLVQLAPTLFAELLLDGGLSYALFRRLDRPWPAVEGPHWLATAVRRTWLPFALTAVLMAVIGAGLALAVPEARSLGEVITRGRG